MINVTIFSMPLKLETGGLQFLEESGSGAESTDIDN